MNRFAELLDRLGYEPGRNNKLRLLTSYFRETEDPDRGYALAALTGALSFKYAKPGLIRDLIAARTDPVLFALSYDYVGDLSETVALMWPKSPSSPLPPRGGGGGGGGGGARCRGLAANRKARGETPHPRPRERALLASDPATRCARGGRGAHPARCSRWPTPSQPPQQPSPAHPYRRRHHAAHARQDRTAKAAVALARRA
jgi:DNA ligase-1